MERDEEVQEKRIPPEMGENAFYHEILSEFTVFNKRRGGADYLVSARQWETPIYMDEYNLPSYPVDINTPEIRNMILSVAEFTQTPPDLAALVALGALSTAVNNKFVIEPTDGWKESLNTYTMPIMTLSTRKTAVYQRMTESIYALETASRKEMEPMVLERNVEIMALGKRADKLMNDFVKTNDYLALNEVKKVNHKLAQLPQLYLPTLLLDDLSPEVVVRLLKQNDEKISILSADGSLLEKLKRKNVPLEVFLSGYNSSPLRASGTGSQIENLTRPLITVCIAVHPNAIKDLPTHLYDRGLMARFLFAFPGDYVGYRTPTPRPISDGVRDQYNNLLQNLLHFTTSNPIVLGFDAAGKEALASFHNSIEKELREDGELQENLKSWGGKLIGQLVRISGLLHIANHATTAKDIHDIPTDINVETLNSAFKLKHYFIAHAAKAFGLMQQNEALADAHYVFEKIQREQRSTISKQEIWQKSKKKFETVERLNSAIRLLISRNYIRLAAGGKSGRKEIIEINPALLESTM